MGRIRGNRKPRRRLATSSRLDQTGPGQILLLMDTAHTHIAKRKYVALASKTRLHKYGIERFLLAAADELTPGGMLLDAGAGNCKHKQLFPKQRVVALDFVQTRRRRYGDLDLSGDLHAIPCKTASFDAIVNVEVLEHLQEPEAALREMFRVLKPGGRLYLIAPQGWEEHCVPRDFYRFTQFGLRYLLEKVGFRGNTIVPLGGTFGTWAIVYRSPTGIFSPVIEKGFGKSSTRRFAIRRGLF